MRCLITINAQVNYVVIVVRKQAHAVPNYDQCAQVNYVVMVVRKQAHAVPNYDQCTGELRGHSRATAPEEG
jgi:hypothetical protein